MKIKEWENYIFKKYGAKKIDNFLDLKNYLTYKDAYSQNFTPEEISEGEIENDEFYSAYVFDEDKIANRKVVSSSNSGWTTTVVFLGSFDLINISNWYAHESNGFTDEERDKFFKDIDPLKIERPRNE